MTLVRGVKAASINLWIEIECSRLDVDKN